MNYWIGRLEFGIGYLDTIEAVRKAATAEQATKDAKERGDEKASRVHLAEAIQQAETALNAARQAIESFARVAKDQSDRGAIATMAEYVYRPLKEQLMELRKK